MWDSWLVMNDKFLSVQLLQWTSSPLWLAMVYHNLFQQVLAKKMVEIH